MRRTKRLWLMFMASRRFWPWTCRAQNCRGARRRRRCPASQASGLAKYSEYRKRSRGAEFHEQRASNRAVEYPLNPRMFEILNALTELLIKNLQTYTGGRPCCNFSDISDRSLKRPDLYDLNGTTRFRQSWRTRICVICMPR